MTDYTDLLLDTAFTAYESGARAEAENILRLVLGRSGKDAQTLYFLGHLAYLRGRLDDAAWFLSRALMMNPGHARAHNDLGETLRALGRSEEAAPYFERAIALEPELVHPYGNLAAALVALNRPEEALRWAQESLRRAPDKIVAHCDLGGIFGRLGRVHEAIREYDLALALQPDNPRARYFRGLMRLSLGTMPDAWTEHEVRFMVPGLVTGARTFPQPRWMGGEDLAGKTILLHAEQGFGDTIQFIRYVPMVAALGATVLVEVQRGLRSFCETIEGAGKVFEAGDDLPAFDLHCSLMSLPAAFQTDLRSIPAAVPYLTARAAALGPWEKMRVGLAWSGSAQHAADRNRSAPLAALVPLLDRSDIECHVIQREIQDADRETMRRFPSLIDHSGELTDFGRTASVIASMDLIVSVDTVSLHLAGALNMSTWAMLAHGADWRWMRDRDDSPWYPSLRLFRQKRRGDWSSVVEQIDANLDQWAIRRG
jgi:Flp pilus assembly protein TadD